VVVALCAALAVSTAAAAQSSAEISVNPSQGAPGSQFTITLKNFAGCPTDRPNCIQIDFVQGATKTTIGTADSKGSPSFSGTVSVPPSAQAGSATVHAFGNTATVGDASTGFTVTGGPAPTTTTTVAGSTTSSSSTSTSTTVAPTTTLTTVVPAITEPTTTTTIATKNASSHSDVPRYIAVVLVVLAAAATAGVDTRLRHLRGGPPPAP
jgi:hypothetical protein